MKLKNKHFYYIAGLVIAFITMIPPVPNGLKYLLALVPILFFGADLTLKYMKEFYTKNFINRNQFILIVIINTKKCFSLFFNNC